jgi:hypothetical protein
MTQVKAKNRTLKDEGCGTRLEAALQKKQMRA